MKNPLTGLAWVLTYLLLAVAPLVLVASAHPPAGRPFLVEFSAALGFVGLAMMGLQFGLVARFKPVAAPFGIDALTKFHKQVSYVALAFILAHPILLFIQDGAKYLPLLNVITAPWRARFAVAAVLLLLVLIGLSVARKRLGLSLRSLAMDARAARRRSRRARARAHPGRGLLHVSDIKRALFWLL